jgi:uncharacterized protein involved in outer membrane biogenesis
MPLDSSKDKISKIPSKPSLKRWIGVPFALILVIAIILTQIDLESVKENLIEKVSSETGLKVEIDSIGFGFTRGLGLQCKGVKVSTPEGDHYSVDRLDLLAAWSPLFRGEFKIKSAALVHPIIKLELPKPKPEQPTEKEQPPEVKEKPIEEPGLVDSETIKSATIKIESNPLSIDKFVISDGEITLTRPGSTQQLLLNIDGTFMLNRDKHLDMSAKSVKVQTGSMVFEGEGAASKLGADDAELSLNLKSGEFSLKQLQPALQFFEVSLQESPLEAVNVDQLILQNKFPLNALSNTELLMQKMTGHVDLKISNAILKTGHSIESLKGEGIWENGALTHDFSGTALGSDFSINGKFPFSGFDKDSISRVEWKDLDLAKLPLPKEMAWSPTQGKVSGKLSLAGPIPKEVDKLKGSVEFQAEGLVLKPANENETRPIEISSLTGRGDFDQGQLQHEIQGAIWGSNFDIKGKFPLNADNPVLNSQLNWTGLDIAQLPLPPNIGWHPTEGKVSGTLTLAGPAPAKGESFPGRLKGSLKFDTQNLKLQNADAKVINLNMLSGDGNIENNRLHYKLKSEVFNGTLLSDGNVTLASTPVLDNQIELTSLDLSQLPLLTAPKKGHVSGTIKLKGPLPNSENLLTGNLNIDMNFKLTDLSMPAGKLPLNVQSFEGSLNLKQGKLTHDLKGNLFDGTVKTKGSLDFHKNKTTSDIMLDHISLGWTPLFHESAPSSGMLTGNLNVKGPLPSEGKIFSELKLKGILQGAKLVFKNQQIEKVKVDFNSSTLTQARVELEKIKIGERDFKKATALFKVTPEKIDLTGGKIWPKNGLIQLTADLQPESGNYRLKFKGDKLMVEDLLQPPHLMGPLQLSGALSGTLPQNNAAPGLPDHARNLSGNIKLELINGAIPELGSVESLLTLLNPTTALNAQKKGLSYDYLGGDFKIVKGVVHTDNFEMKSPQVNMNVVGKANLVEDTVLAQVKAMPLQMLDKTIKAIPLLGQILGGGKKGGLIEIHVKVDGKLSQPNFAMQPHKSLMEKPGSILKGLLNLPGNLSGGK